MSKEAMTTGRVPPYVPFKTFKQVLLDMAGSVVPRRMDSSYWGPGKSGATQASLNSAFKFFGFVNDNKDATPKLDDFVKRLKAKDKDALRELIFEAYQDATGKVNDLDSATLGQLRESFKSAYSLDGGMLQKALRFFIHATTDAGVTLSPYITSGTRGSGRASAKPRGRAKRGRDSMPRQEPATSETFNRTASVAELLLNKFPDFDPEWSEETKQKWFDSLRDLKQLLQNDTDK